MIPLSFQNRSFNVREMYFHFKGIRYDGSGILDWDSKSGFTLYSKTKGQFPKGYKYQGNNLGTIFPKVRCYFKFDKYQWGFSDIFISDIDVIGCISGEEFIKSFDTLILFDRNHSPNYKSVQGYFFAYINNDSYFFETVDYFAKIGDLTINESRSVDGLFFEDDNIKVLGQKRENNLYKIDWKLKTSKFDKSIINIDNHLRNCLAVCTGQTLPLLGAEIYRKRSNFTKLTKEEEIRKIPYMHLIPRDNKIQKDAFSNILNNMLMESVAGTVTKNIFYRLASAFSTRNYDILEFIIPTTLEAILRTLEGAQLTQRKKDSNWDIYASLKRFQEKYFNDDKYRKEWKDIRKDVKEIYNDLRHKTAHPSWTESTNLQSVSGQQYFSDLLFLCEFYGKMILAINGCNHIQPDIHRKKT